MAVLDSTGNAFAPLFDIGATWIRLWRGRWTVLAAIGAALGLSLLYLSVTKPSYTATAALLIDPRDARSTGFETVLPGIGADSAAVASQVFVIESRDLLMAVFEGEGIEHDPEFADGGLFSFLGGSGRDAVFRRFERRVSVERAGLTYVIDVSFKSDSASKAARIANAIVERYRAGLAGDRESANAAVNTRLAGRIVPLQKNVAEADRAVGEFRVQHAILDPAAGGTLKDQIDQLTAQLIEARAVAERAGSRYDQAMAAGTSPVGLAKLSEIVSSATIDGLRADYNQRVAALANAEAIYQARHPTIRRLQSELSRIRMLLGAEAKRIARELKAKQDLAGEAVVSLEAKLAALRGASQAADAARVELRRLEARADAARTVLEDVLKRAEETAQMRGLQLSEARVIGLAAPPVEPTWPKPLLLLPVSAAFGLLVGCGLAVAGGRAVRRRKTATAARDDATRGATEAPALALPVSFGHYELPGLPGVGAASRIRAMRRYFLQRGGEAFSRSTLALVRRIVGHLSEHAAPYTLLVSCLRSPAEAKLAGVMIGIGLQQAGQNVLIVEFTCLPQPDGVDTDIFVNGASGLPTAVRPLLNGEGNPAFALEEALAADFDFVLLLGPPLGAREWDTACFAPIDLMLFALAPEEDVALANDILRRTLGEAGLSRSATLVIARDAASDLALPEAGQ